MKEIFNDGVMRATLLDDNWVVVEWLTNNAGFLCKQVVKDLYAVEEIIKKKKYAGWVLGSEKANTDMHRLIDKFGGIYQQDFDGYKIFRKEVK